MRPVKVTARLATELSGAPPQLDALLIKARCRMYESPPHERYDPAPPLDKLPPCPIHRERIGGWIVHFVSSPILSTVESDRHERIAQHFPRELSTKLAPSQQGVIATTNGAQKSQWLPIRRRLVDRVVWFAVVHDSPKDLRRELRRSVTHIGMDRARGHGRVAEWTVEIVDEDWSRFSPHPEGQVLMRQLPWREGAEWLPRDMVGFVRDYDSVTPPYWHQGRRTEIVRPC